MGYVLRMNDCVRVDSLGLDCDHGDEDYLVELIEINRKALA